jgi:hypothetical protein
VVKEIIVAGFALDPGAFEVSVTGGIVTITGLVESRAIAPQLITAIRHAEGVVGVRDRLSCPRARRTCWLSASAGPRSLLERDASHVC